MTRVEGSMPMHTIWKLAPRRRRLGFTAIELTAVASIIAILALILMPIVRKRVAQTRLVAAEDDMRTIEIAETLANADTGFFFRLSDLNNPSVIETLLQADPEGAIRTVPNGYWNQPITNFFNNTNFDQAALSQIVQNWKGPYTSFNNTKSELLAVLLTTQPEMFRTFPGSGPGSNDGPILVLTGGSSQEDDDLLRDEETPIDPWGNPYLFFGPNRVGRNAGTIALNQNEETDFGVSIVYSLGPNGLPGNLVNPTSRQFFRDAGTLGLGDDLSRTF